MQARWPCVFLHQERYGINVFKLVSFNLLWIEEVKFFKNGNGYQNDTWCSCKVIRETFLSRNDLGFLYVICYSTEYDLPTAKDSSDSKTSDGNSNTTEEFVPGLAMGASAASSASLPVPKADGMSQLHFIFKCFAGDWFRSL